MKYLVCVSNNNSEHYFASNSRNSKQHIRDYYGMDSSAKCTVENNHHKIISMAKCDGEHIYNSNIME